jgi:two-component system OmpR family response regulator
MTTLNKTILIVDDEIKTSDVVRAYLEKNGYDVIIALDGKDALEQVCSKNPDLILLDLNLPFIDGIEVCKIVRSNSRVPIIMLTARDEEDDKIIGLELGADDYITKPFSPRELVSRVKALFRRLDEGNSYDHYEETTTVGELWINFDRHEAKYFGQDLSLTPREFSILSVLARNPGLVYSRQQLLDKAYDISYEGLDRTIDAHIKNIRRKMVKINPDCPIPLITVFGIGYKLENG